MDTAVPTPPVIFQNEGFCPCCDATVTFTASDPWFRDFYRCPQCGSLPRERALFHVLEKFYPDYASLTIHESSPVWRGASAKLKKNVKNYIPTQYFEDIPAGRMHQGFRCENLEHLSFPDNSIDLHVSQDVMEHVFAPEAAFAEIGRTLRPGGAHIFTVPLVNKLGQSRRCAVKNDQGDIVHLVPPSYHGNPVSEQGSLVTMEWGYDIVEHIFAASGLFTTIFYIDNIDLGIRAEYIEVLMTRK